MVVEPSRYTISHVTNILALGNDADQNRPFDKMSMTQGGSDPNRGVDPSEKDPRLDTVAPKKVTDRDIASVANNPQLKGELRKSYDKRIKESDGKIQNAKSVILKDFLIISHPQ